MDHRTVGYNSRGPLGVGVALSLAHLHTGSKYCTVTHLVRFDHFQPLIRQCAAYCVCYRTNDSHILSFLSIYQIHTILSKDQA